jgi:hypothetical protein
MSEHPEWYAYKIGRLPSGQRAENDCTSFESIHYSCHVDDAFRIFMDDDMEEEPAEPQTRNAFRFRAYWFVLAQTEGEETYVVPIPGFDLDTALRALDITRTAFDEINGNIQEFARQRGIAVNPLASLPHKTTFHEIAHVVLGHTTSKKLVDGEHTPRHLCEVEAESVALICCETLELNGAEFCRGYTQHWLKTEKEIPNHNAAHIFAAVTSILKAGTPAPHYSTSRR